MRLWSKRHVDTAANGHLMVSWPDAGHLFFTVLCAWLRLRHGLRREGRVICSPGDIILPDLVGRGVRLKSGWDNWSGYYLLAEDEAGDTFLKRFTSDARGDSRKPRLKSRRR